MLNIVNVRFCTIKINSHIGTAENLVDALYAKNGGSRLSLQFDGLCKSTWDALTVVTLYVRVWPLDGCTVNR